MAWVWPMIGLGSEQVHSSDTQLTDKKEKGGRDVERVVHRNNMTMFL